MPDTITHERLIASLELRGFTDCQEIELVKRHNHVWRLTWHGRPAFLKVFTKSWYQGDGTGFCVDHEAAFARRLTVEGLPGLEVLDAVTHSDHPIGHPYLLTAGVPGTDAVTALGTGDAGPVLRLLAGWLHRCHEIHGARPGYFSSRGPGLTRHPQAYEHTSWTWQALTADAERLLVGLPGDLSAPIRQELATGAAQAWYNHPALIHGDSHAHQFFIKDGAIAGVVDFEVGGFGAAGTDLVTICIELAGVLRHEPDWWEPFFEAYGPVSFPALRSLFLVRDPSSFRIHGIHRWPGDDVAIRRHLLRARDWRELFALERIGE